MRIPVEARSILHTEGPVRGRDDGCVGVASDAATSTRSPRPDPTAHSTSRSASPARDGTGPRPDASGRGALGAVLQEGEGGQGLGVAYLTFADHGPEGIEGDPLDPIDRL